MIAIGIPAEVRCDEEGCTEALEAELALMASGGFGFKPKGGGAAMSGWQVGVTANGMFLSYCAAHKKEAQRIQTQIGPAGRRMVVKNGR